MFLSFFLFFLFLFVILALLHQIFYAVKLTLVSNTHTCFIQVALLKNIVLP